MKRLTAPRLHRMMFACALLQLLLGLILYMAASVSLLTLVIEILAAVGCGVLSYYRDASRRYARVLRRIWCLLLPSLFFLFWLAIHIWRSATSVYTEQLPIEAWYALSILLLPALYSVQPLAVVGLRANRRWDRVLLRVLAPATLVFSILYFTQNNYLGSASIYHTPVILRVLCCLCGAAVCAGAYMPLFYHPSLQTDAANKTKSKYSI